MGLVSPVEIFSANFFNEKSAMSASSGGPSKDNLYSQDTDEIWMSGGSDDSIVETITVTFKNSCGADVLQSFDRIIIQNTNAKKISASYINDLGETVSLPEASIESNCESDLIIELSSLVSAWAFSLNLETTQTADAQKYLGGLKICAFALNLGSALTEFFSQDWAKRGEYYTCGGKLVAWTEFQKKTVNFSVRNLLKEDLDSFMLALKESSSMVFLFDASAKNAREFLVSPPKLGLDRRTGLYSLSAELKER
ncbi:MAG: hypothetical protein NTW04_02850 [Elusimicrobia bacterium]|nr:hypothetical protein [Elusimicrobiota bacterium]